MREPSQLIELSVELPVSPDLGHIDQGLQRCFDLAALNWAKSPGAGSTGESVMAQALLVRAMALYPVLAQACRIPCFEPGRLLRLHRLEDGPGLWVARLLLPAHQHLQTRLLRQVAQRCILLISRLATLETSAEAREALLQELDHDLVQRLRRLIPGGASTVPQCEAARGLDIPLRHLDRGIYQLGWGSARRWLDRSASDRDSALGIRLCEDKHATAGALREAGLPAAEHLRVASLAQARNAAAALGWPLVVKPSARERGEGVSVDIHSESELERAYGQARRYGSGVLIERQAAGVCHRLLVAGGQLIYAIKRLPQHVTGDGLHSVRELVEIENSKLRAVVPWMRRKLLPLDELALAQLQPLGLGFDDVPARGQYVPLRQIESGEWGGISEDVSDRVHPDNAAAALAAASVMGLDVAGVDMICEDIAQPWHESGAIINEVNFAPLFARNPQTLGRRESFIRSLLPGDGRIPVCAVLGSGDLLAKARQVQAQWVGRGLRCYLTGSQVTECPDGRALALPDLGLFGRSHALLARSDVDAIVLVLDSPDFLTTGLPVDRIDRIESLGQAQDAETRSLLALLRHYHPTPARPVADAQQLLQKLRWRSMPA
jgi:cyanophycin synthetase